jgi:hypothetical protein
VGLPHSTHPTVVLQRTTNQTRQRGLEEDLAGASG